MRLNEFETGAMNVKQLAQVAGLVLFVARFFSSIEQ